MKINFLNTILLLTISTVGIACAKQATWLDGGAKVHADTTESTLTTKNTTNQTIEVRLATGTMVSIKGGVYVKTTKINIVLDWAIENGYVAEEHEVIKGAIIVKTTPEQAIKVANLIAELEGVTTSAPRQQKKLISK